MIKEIAICDVCHKDVGSRFELTPIRTQGGVCYDVCGDCAHKLSKAATDAFDDKLYELKGKAVYGSTYES